MNQFWVSPYLGEYLMTKSNIARQFAQVQPGMLHVGVDLALEKNVVIVINEKGQRLDHFSFPQDRGGYDYFLRRLAELRQRYQAPGVLVAMEPSNYFWKLLAKELEEKHIPYRLVNAYTVKKHREGDQLDQSKDDRRDAAQIAELSRSGHYTQTRLQKGAYEELRQYATLHDQLIQAIVREKNVLWGLVGQVFPELSQVFKDLSGETCQAFLGSFAAAASLRQLNLGDFLARVRTAFSGKKLCVSKLRQAYCLAATSIGVTEGLQAIQLAIQVHLAELQTFQQQLNRVISAMTACLAPMPESPYLLSLKSFSLVSAALFLAEVGDPYRYHSSAQWVKLAGIQPAPNTSGKRQRSKTPMSHHGRSRLRSMLYFTCLRLVHQDDHFAQLYSHLQRRPNNPLTKMQAIGVLMNKLLHILWALIHHQTFYNPSFDQSI
jgi:transposase